MTSSRQQRIVIVDYECMSALGVTLDETWQRLIGNASGIGYIDRYAASEQALLGVSEMEFGGQIPATYAELAGSPGKQTKWPEPSVHALKRVCKRMLERLDFDISRHDGYRIALLGGTALTSTIVQDVVSATGKPLINSMLCQCQNIPLSAVAMEFGIQGPLFSVGSACASSAHATLIASNFLRAGLIDAALVCGFEFPFVPVNSAGFVWLNAVYRRDNPDDRAYDDPAQASRPFSADRRGFLMAEGVGAVLVCREDYARHVGWPIKGIVRGGYLTSDASGYTGILSTSIKDCMSRALEASETPLSDVDCINAHATSTPLGDKTELAVLHELFGDRLRDVPVVANKSQIGHSLGATSILEMMLAVEGMNQEAVLPTLNYQPDPSLPPAFVPAETIERRHRITLANSFGFGGTNASLVLEAPP